MESPSSKEQGCLGPGDHFWTGQAPALVHVVQCTSVHQSRGLRMAFVNLRRERAPRPPKRRYGWYRLYDGLEPLLMHLVHSRCISRASAAVDP